MPHDGHGHPSRHGHRHSYADDFEKIDLKAMVNELAKLSPLEYDQIRTEQADRLGVRRQTLDRAVKEARANKSSTKTEDAEEEVVSFLCDPIPWDEQVDAAILLDEIAEAAARHLVLPAGGADTIALWVVFAHAHDCFDISPLLTAISPTPECGKTTLLTLISAIVPRPLPASNVTPAVLFRAVEKWAPTLLIDEADTFLAGNDELRGILNSGHNRAYAYVLRAVGEDFEPKQFRVWAPKAIAKIGALPPTLHSRSIQIKLQRKKADEKVEPLRADRLDHLDPLRRMAARWVADNNMSLKIADPEIPAALHGRIADNWRPLFAIADLAGGKWPKRARSIADSAVSRASDETAGIVLLADIESIFERLNIDRIHSDELVSHLGAMEDRPWAEWGRAQKPITRNQLAELLKPFDVEPKQLKIDGVNKRGYELEALSLLFTRYQSATPLHPLQDKALRVVPNATAQNPVAFQKALNPLEIKAGSAVAPQNPLSGENDGDRDPFASLKDASFGLQAEPEAESADWPEMPTFLDRRRTADQRERFEDVRARFDALPKPIREAARHEPV